MLNDFETKFLCLGQDIDGCFDALGVINFNISQAVLQSASINLCRHWPSGDLWPSRITISPGGKSCALAPLNIIPKFPKEKHKFLSDLSSKSSTFMCSICMIAKGYKVFPWKLCQSKNGVCDESPPKRRTVAETFAWRLAVLLSTFALVVVWITISLLPNL